jgi:hypothetical protein
MILKEPAGTRQMFVNAYLIYKMGDSDFFDEIVQVKIPREPFVADQRVIIKKLKNGWKIWGSGLDNIHNNSGANSITTDKSEFDKYIKLGINNIEQKALSENKMTNKRKLVEMVRKIIKEQLSKEEIKRTLTSDKNSYFLTRDGDGWILDITPRAAQNSTFYQKFDVEDLGKGHLGMRYRLTK